VLEVDGEKATGRRYNMWKDVVLEENNQGFSESEKHGL
jgi:hypothetical protein